MITEKVITISSSGAGSVIAAEQERILAEAAKVASQTARSGSEAARDASAASATAAATSETNAAASAVAAANSQAASATSESNAAASAVAAANSAAVSTSQATLSTTARIASEAAQTASELAESNAAASELAAATSETNAASSASASANSATAAAASATAAATSESNAAASELAAATSETNAASSASASANSATAAAASATAAATSETNAASSATAAATSASAALSSELAAATSETNAASSASAAATSATASAASATAAATSETNAASSASAAATSATAALSSELAAATSETNAAASEANAAASENAAAAAAAAAVAVSYQDLTAIAAAKAVTAVDVFVYDTSKDSDGGAWRKRTQHTSWYNETLNTATRGSRREFPAVAVIVAEATKVTIYDGDDPTLPMWMVFEASTDVDMLYGAFSASLTSIVMRNAVLVTGANPYALNIISFLADTGRYINNSVSGSYFYKGTISERNDNKNVIQDGFYGPIVNSTVNDVAMTVLPDAPIDPATGLQVPTIAVATAGGVSVIKDDGTVVDSASVVVTSVSIDQEKLSYVRVDECRVIALANIVADGFTYDRRYNTGPTYSASFLPQPLSGSNKPVLSDSVSFAASSGLTRLYEDTSNQTKGMVAYITSTYNTGWMNGDIKGAFLSSTDATSLVGSGELVTNGTFDTDTTGWTPSFNASLSVVSGKLRVTNDSASNASAYQDFTTVTGEIYVISLEQTQVSSRLLIGTPTNASNALVTSFSTGTNLFTFIATGTTTRLTLQSSAGAAGQYSDFDNVSVQLADADRSVNG